MPVHGPPGRFTQLANMATLSEKNISNDDLVGAGNTNNVSTISL